MKALGLSHRSQDFHDSGVNPNAGHWANSKRLGAVAAHGFLALPLRIVGRDRIPMLAGRSGASDESNENPSAHFDGRLFQRDRARNAGNFAPPPSRPRATACGFFSASTIGSSSASPTDISTMRLASWFMSRGRGGRVLLMPPYLATLQKRSSRLAERRPFKLSHYRPASSVTLSPRIRRLKATRRRRGPSRCRHPSRPASGAWRPRKRRR